MTHTNKDNQAERAAFEAWAEEAKCNLERDKELPEEPYINTTVRLMWLTWQAARTSAPALDAEGLPAAHVFCAVTSSDKPLFGKGWMFSPVPQMQAQTPLYTAEQVRQAQRDAIAADRRARLDSCSAFVAMANRLRAKRDAEIAELRKIGGQMANVMFNLAQRPGDPLTGDVVATMDSLRKQWDAAVHANPAARQDQQPARASVDTANLKRLLFEWHGAAGGAPSVAAYEAIIAHINAWGGVEQSSGKEGA